MVFRIVIVALLAVLFASGTAFQDGTLQSEANRLAYAFKTEIGLDRLQR
jgi:hypothetical protein